MNARTQARFFSAWRIYPTRTNAATFQTHLWFKRRGKIRAEILTAWVTTKRNGARSLAARVGKSATNNFIFRDKARRSRGVANTPGVARATMLRGTGLGCDGGKPRIFSK